MISAVHDIAYDEPGSRRISPDVVVANIPDVPLLWIRTPLFALVDNMYTESAKPAPDSVPLLSIRTRSFVDCIVISNGVMISLIVDVPDKRVPLTMTSPENSTRLFVVSNRTNVVTPSLISNDDVEASAMFIIEPLFGNDNSDDMKRVFVVDVDDVNDVNAPEEGTENPMTVLSIVPADMSALPTICMLFVEADRRNGPDMVVMSLFVMLTLSTMNGDDV